jgi:hypothetical protein
MLPLCVALLCLPLTCCRCFVCQLISSRDRSSDCPLPCLRPPAAMMRRAFLLASGLALALAQQGRGRGGSGGGGGGGGGGAARVAPGGIIRLVKPADTCEEDTMNYRGADGKRRSVSPGLVRGR